MRCYFECVTTYGSSTNRIRAGQFCQSGYEIDVYTSDFVDRAAEVLVVARHVAVRRGIFELNRKRCLEIRPH